MRIAIVNGSVPHYDFGLNRVISIVATALTELDMEIDQINLGFAQMSYFDGLRARVMDDIISRLRNSKGVILACTSQLFAPSSILQTFLEFLECNDYNDVLFEKYCLPIVVSKNGGERTALDYLGRTICYFGGFESGRIGLQENYAMTIEGGVDVELGSVRDIVEKIAEDFYRAVRQNRKYIVPLDNPVALIAQINHKPTQPSYMQNPNNYGQNVYLDKQEQDIQELTEMFSQKYAPGSIGGSMGSMGSMGSIKTPSPQQYQQPQYQPEPPKYQQPQPQYQQPQYQQPPQYQPEPPQYQQPQYQQPQQPQYQPEPQQYQQPQYQQPQQYQPPQYQQEPPKYQQQPQPPIYNPPPEPPKPERAEKIPPEIREIREVREVQEITKEITKEPPEIKEIKEIKKITEPKPLEPTETVTPSVKTTKQMTQNLPHYFQPHISAGLRAVIQFNITGEETFNGYISVLNSECEYTDGIVENPEITITADAKNWKEVLKGNQTAQRAFMIGRIKVRGNFVLLTKFDSLFKL